jgi:hypothetical protein
MLWFSIEHFAKSFYKQRNQILGAVHLKENPRAGSFAERKVYD